MRTYTEPQEVDANVGITTPSVPEDLPIRALYHAIVDELDLDWCWRVHPHFYRKDVIKELGLRNGPQLGLYVEDQTRWMQLNPHGKREECVANMRERKMEREGEPMIAKSDKEADHSSKKFRVEN